MSDDTLSAYDYDLPPELMASHPLPERDASRLLVLDRPSGRVSHRQFCDFPELLRPGDLLVLNETRVVPARLVGIRTETGGRWEGLYLGVTADGDWRLIGQTRGKLKSGESVTLRPTASAATARVDEERLELLFVEKTADGEWAARPSIDAPPLELLESFGAVPLPPYIKRQVPDDADRERYQTTYARSPGAVAAPTAGLHFTPQVLDRCLQRGIDIAYVTLHVGLGTFRPVSVEDLSAHVMHHEWCELPQDTADAVMAAKSRKRRVIAVGTTTVRTLESVASGGPIRSCAGDTDLFIRPPFEFRIIDGLLTNFHLPKSTLLMLVSAFAGRDNVLNAYRTAIEERYRFYSYGDAMFVV